MIDSLVQFKPVFKQSRILEEIGLDSKAYFVFTFHRPGNVDNKSKLTELVDTIRGISSIKKVVFPVHPRTKNKV